MGFRISSFGGRNVEPARLRRTLIILPILAIALGLSAVVAGCHRAVPASANTISSEQLFGPDSIKFRGRFHPYLVVDSGAGHLGLDDPTRWTSIFVVQRGVSTPDDPDVSVWQIRYTVVVPAGRRFRVLGIYGGESSPGVQILDTGKESLLHVQRFSRISETAIARDSLFRYSNGRLVPVPRTDSAWIRLLAGPALTFPNAAGGPVEAFLKLDGWPIYQGTISQDPSDPSSIAFTPDPRGHDLIVATFSDADWCGKGEEELTKRFYAATPIGEPSLGGPGQAECKTILSPADWALRQARASQGGRDAGPRD